MFCGKRLEGIAVASRNGAHPDQQQLPGVEGEHAPHVESVFDSKRLALTPKHFSAGLTVALESIDVGDLAHIAKRDGRIRVSVLGPIEVDEGDAQDDDTDDEGEV